MENYLQNHQATLAVVGSERITQVCVCVCVCVSHHLFVQNAKRASGLQTGKLSTSDMCLPFMC
jgi:hypothetical protein